jgi:hypothetical protein
VTKSAIRSPILIALADRWGNRKQHEAFSDAAKHVTTLPRRNRELIDALYLESVED